MLSQSIMAGSKVEHLTLFPRLTEDVVTGIRVFSCVKDAKGEKIEMQIGSIKPDATSDEFIEQFGDGLYRIEALAISPHRKSPEILETRQYPIAVGRPPTWLSRAKQAARNSGSDIPGEEGEGDDDAGDDSPRHRRLGDRPGRPSADDPMGQLRDPLGEEGDPFLSRFGGAPGLHGSAGGAPVVVPISKNGVTVPVAQGLDPERQQEIIDRARKEEREDTKDMTMINLVMQMLQQQQQAAQREAESLRQVLVSGSGGGRGADSEASSAMISALRRELDDVSDRLRKARADADEDVRRMRANMDDSERRYRNRVDELEKENRDLRSELVAARGEVQKTQIDVEVQKMMAASGIPKESQQDVGAKLSQLKMLMDAIGPVAMPLIWKLLSGLTGGAGQGLPGGDVMAGAAGGSLPGT